jgi:hypothetical protein
LADSDHDLRGWGSDPLGRFQKSLARRLLSPFDARATGGKLVKEGKLSSSSKSASSLLPVEATFASHRSLPVRSCGPTSVCPGALFGFVRFVQIAAMALSHMRTCSRDHQLHTVAEVQPLVAQAFGSASFVTDR